VPRGRACSTRELPFSTDPRPSRCSPRRLRATTPWSRSSSPTGPEDSDAFLAWQATVTAAERRFRGFRGKELFRPVPGVQDDWTALYRFDTAENLEAWLESAERQQLLEEGLEFQDFELRQIDSSFGNCFSFDGRGDEPPPGDVKTSIAVWVGLYPTVVFLAIVIAKIWPGLKLWQGLLLGNLLSSFMVTYLTMPRYINPLFRFRLRPAKNAREPRTNLQGIALVIALQAFWAVLFFLVTDLIWKLP
jgi:antibiotic biosynthesis monooxygenase (ABM) superfamily enzyme